MSQDSMSNVFAEALKAKVEQQAEVEQKKNYVPGDYEEITYCAFDTKEKAIRPVGYPFNPQTLQSPNDTDIKIFMHSQVVCDDGEKYVHINWPAKVKTQKTGVKIVADPDYILTKLYNKVMERSWIAYPEGKTEIRNGRKCTGEWKYHHKDTEIFKRIQLNGKRGEFTKFEPKERVVMNVIDRSDDWCEKNKHTKILVSKINVGKPYKNEATGEMITPSYPDKGISNSTYDVIFETLVKKTGGWNKDIVIKKTGVKLDTEYKIYEAIPARVEVGDISSEVFATCKDEGIPSDWVLYDTKKLTNASSAFKLKKSLEGLFKLFDATFNDHLLEELKEIAKIEEEEYKKSHPSETSAETSIDAQKQEQAKALTTETKVEEPAKRERTSPVANSPKPVAELCAENFESWNKLSEDDKKILINHIDHFNGTIPVYKTQINGKPVELGPCSPDPCYYKGTNETTNFPLDMKVCPSCGAQYN